MSLRQAAQSAVFSASQAGRVLLVIDGLDQLDEDRSTELEWLPRDWPAGVTVVVSSSSASQLRLLSARTWKVQPLPGFSRRERRDFVSGYLARFCKRLESRFVSLVVDHPASQNCLFMQSLLDELRVIGQFVDFGDDVGRLAAATNLPALFSIILARLERAYADNGRLDVGDVLALLASARWGLTEPELRDLSSSMSAPAPAVRIAPLLSALTDQLVSRAGILSFAHGPFARAIQEDSSVHPRVRSPCDGSSRITSALARNSTGPS